MQLKGKIVKFWVREHTGEYKGVRKYQTYGKVRDISRVTVHPGRMAEGIETKTEQGFKITQSSWDEHGGNWDGDTHYVPKDDVVAVRFRGKDIPIGEWDT